LRHSIRELSIREAEPEDYEELSGLMMAAYEEFAESLGEEWEGYHDELTDVARRASRGTQLVAETAGHLVGTVSYYPPQGKGVADEWSWWPKGFAYLRALGVHPQSRGRGVGRALTVACLERARADGAAGIALNSVSIMSAATALYEGLGFRRTGGTAEWGGRELLSYVLDIDDTDNQTGY
jgi:ribosomal protein S18 acetylase RimI-like enzyme